MFKFYVTDCNGDGFTSLKIEVKDKRGKFVDLFFCNYDEMIKRRSDLFSLYRNAEVIWSK